MENSYFEIIAVPSSNILLTVALPVYNSKEIAWLCLESLINQENVTFDWELLVYEEKHDKSVFPEILEKYKDHLVKINCKRIVYLTNQNKISLTSKWQEMALNCSVTSKCFLLQAADCYSPKNRLSITHQKIVKENYDWYDQKKGYFYSFEDGKVYLYDYNGLTNLNMATKPEYIISLQDQKLTKGIDGYIYKHILQITKNKLNRFLDEEIYPDSIDTHGLNNISKLRTKFFQTRPDIFKQTKLTVHNFNLKEEIINRLLGLTVNFNQTRKKYQLSILISTYENVEYLTECFNSIINTTKEFDIEVLVGIDSCNKSFEFISSRKYPDNFRFYFFEENNGPYVVFNTLSNIASSDNLLFFGSDDVMNQDMVGNILKRISFCDFIRSSYVEFKDGEKRDPNGKRIYEGGVFTIKKQIFDHLNGFEPWKCEADSEFVTRLFKNNYKGIMSNNLDFYRRLHKKGLTSRPETGYNSKLRMSYKKQYLEKTNFGPLIEKKTAKFIIINPGKYETNVEPVNFVEKRDNVLGGFLNRQVNIDVKEIDYGKVNEVTQNRELQKEKTHSRPERPINENSNTNAAKRAVISKKPVKPVNSSPNSKIGKDFLRI